MGKNYLYTIYLFSVLLITIFISIWIINTNFSESRNFKNNDNILEPTEDCPCDKPGKELPGCERDFIVNEEKPWKLVKNYTGIYDGNVVCLNPSILNINSHGFRDREYKINKPNNTYRIIVLGDSISFGQGLNLSQIYHQRIERMLNTRLKNDAKYQVLNFGVVDLNTKMELEFFKEVGLKFDPDLVLLQYTANDFSNETGLRELINEKRKELFLSYSKNNDISVASIRTNEALNSKLSKIAHKRAKIEHKNMLHEKGRKKMWHKLVGKQIKELVSLGNNTYDVYTFEFTNQGVESEKLLKELSKEHDGIFYIGLSDKIKKWRRKYNKEKLNVGRGDQHPSKFFNKLIADYLYEKLLSEIKTR